MKARECAARIQGQTAMLDMKDKVQERSESLTRRASPCILHPASFILLLLVCAAWAAFGWALVAQHRAYNSSAFDLGFFDQVVWNTAHGRWFETTFVQYNFLGQHIEPVLLLFAAVYRWRPNVEILLLTQAAAAAWAAVPLYLATRRALASAWAGLLVAAAYLLAPHLHGAVLFDFHPEVMGTAGIFSAFALLAAGRPGWALAAVGSLFLLKEEAALAGLGIALVVWLHGYRRHAIMLLAASALYLVVVVGALMTAVRGGPGDLPARYRYLGTDARSVLAAPFRRPGVIVAHLTGPAQREAVADLLGTQALLPLAGPAALAAVPLLAVNLLSTHPPQTALSLHYAVLPFAILMVAAVLGAQRLARSRRARVTRQWLRLDARRCGVLFAGVLLLAEAAGWLAASPLGLRFDPDRYRRTPHVRAVERVVRAVPAGASVSAQSGLLPHLSQRREVWEFPVLRDATYVLVDRQGWRSSQSAEAGYERVLASLPERGYCLVMEDDGVVLYARGDLCASR